MELDDVIFGISRFVCEEVHYGYSLNTHRTESRSALDLSKHPTQCSLAGPGCGCGCFSLCLQLRDLRVEAEHFLFVRVCLLLEIGSRVSHQERVLRCRD